jgi:folate-binding protein YgfZ
MNNFSSFVAPLTDLAVIEISGQDAASFLHGQLTHDISGLTPNHARYAGYCTPKGRLLGTMVIWQSSLGDAPALRAIVKADVAPALIKRLSMFVLRAKAKLELTQLKVLGITLDASSNYKEEAAQVPGYDLLNKAAVLSAQAPAWSVARTDAGCWIAAPSTDSGVTRWWFVATSDDYVAADEVAGSPDAIQAGERWRAAEVAAGLPWIQAATQDVFIPQTLNLDLIDGVSFTKGCYPGQEVVARSHYRGTVKRRMAYGVVKQPEGIDVLTLAGTDTFNAKNPGNPCGRIINAAQSGNIHVLMEVQLGDLDSADFRLGSADGPLIEVLPLPYRITAEE